MLLISCSRKLTNTQITFPKIEFGEYHFVKDSIENVNPNYFESIHLFNGGHFEYRQRMSSFINYSLNGKWEVENDTLILNSKKVHESIVNIGHCNLDTNQYLFKVKNLDGQLVNYSIIIDNGEAIETIRDQYGQTKHYSPLSIKSVILESTAGFRSKPFLLNSEEKCYQVKFYDKRSFSNEKWVIFNKKIQPLFAGNERADYFLYKKDE